VYSKTKSILYKQIKRFPKFRQLLPLKINNINSMYDVVSTGGLQFVILRESLDMRELLVSEDFVEHGFVLRNTTPRRFLDLGCHIGSWSIYFASKGVDIIGVDANQDLLTCLRASLQLNDSVGTVFSEVVGPSTSKVKFALGQNSLTGSASKTLNPIDGITPISLPKLLERFSPDFLKLDIEGLDLECVLETPQHLLKHLKYLVVELDSSGAQVRDLITHLGAAELYPIGFFDLRRNFYNPESIIKLKLMGNLHFMQRELKTGFPEKRDAFS